MFRFGKRWKIWSLLTILLLLPIWGIGPPISSSAPYHTADAAANTPHFLSTSDDTYTIKLRSREFIPTPGLSVQEQSRLNAIAQGGQRIHALVQLHDIPSPAERNALATQGIQLLTYVPNRAWVASIPGDKLESVAATPGVRWLGELRADDKLAPEIRAEQFGPWHYDAARDVVAVVIELHEDVDLNMAQDLVLDSGGMVRDYMHTINSVMAEVPRQALRTLAADDRVLWVETALPSLTPTNDGARAALNVNVLHPAPYNATPTYNLDGTGIDALVYDVGQVWDHPDFGTRLTHGDTTGFADHATHVAGTVGSDGTESAGDGGTAWQWRGMAPNVDIVSYGYEWDGTGTLFYTNMGDINNDWDDAKNIYGVDLGTASLGSNLAWNHAIDPIAYSCAFEGNYGQTSQLMDNIVRGSLGEPYIATWAAGNERGGACGNQYNTTAPPACAKNLIQVGATNSNNNSMTTFSSWGPCDDGRLKPIVVAPGCQSNGDLATHSTIPDLFINQYTRNCDGTGDDYCYPYDNMCGTSMAAPAVAGIIALMLQQYRDTYNTAGEFLPSTAKALLMNTATDLGNAGPDFQFGYGHVDAQATVDAIIDGLFREGTMGATAEVDWYAIQVPAGAAQLQVSLAWDDPGVAPLTTPALVNNLDLALLDPDGGLHQPWVLDPGNPANAATTGVDNLNNQEQVTINAPAAGVWRVRVTGTAVPIAPQSYSLAATHNMFSLDIKNPTNGAPTNVGYYGDPDKLLISLDLRDRKGSLGATIDSTTDLAFSIGGSAPVSVFPGSSVGDYYWVLVTPPTQSSAGCYDLEVTLFGLVTDEETNAVCYGNTPQPNEDIMLVIDSSGSMSADGKMPATQDAAKFFVTATALDDMIGMDTFSTTAALMYPLTTVTGSTIKDAVNDEVDDLVAYGWTAMGAGIQIANTELMTNGDAAHDHTMVLLSDGEENQTPMWAAVSGSIPASTVIHTVALGPDCATDPWDCPNETKLSNIASGSNGNYYRVLTGGGSPDQVMNVTNATVQASDLENVLADVYRSAAEETYGWERLWEASGEVGEYCENISDTYQVYVEQGLAEALFAVHWSDSTGASNPLELKRPNGTTVNPGDADVVEHRLVSTPRGSGHEQYRILTPPSGNWTVNIRGGYSACGEYIAMIEARSNANLLLLSPRPGQHIGFCQKVPLLTAFMGPSKPILGATVQASLVGPATSGQVFNTPLYDDGNHGDGKANDGWYGNLFDPCPQGPPDVLPLGSYQVWVHADGFNEEEDEPVTRSDSGAYHATGSTTGDPDPEPATILLVDDDEDAPDVRSTYTNALDGIGASYHVWDVVSHGPPTGSNLTPYHTVIWFTGEDTDATLSAGDETALGEFLDGGGKLFLSSQNYFYDVGFVNTFMQNYLHISAAQNDVGASSVSGVAGNAVGDGLGPYALTSPPAEYVDRLTPGTPGGQAAFVNEGDSTVAVSFADGSYCTLFAAFPFERLNAGNAQEMMERVLDWKCWDPSILVSPSEVEDEVWTGTRRFQTVDVSNPGQGKLTWAVNSGPIHLWAVTDADGEVPTFLNNLDSTTMIQGDAGASEALAISDEVRLDVCTVTSGVADCCASSTCTAAELLDQDVLVIYSDQAFADPSGLGDMLADFVDQGGAVIVATNALVQGANGLGGSFMNEDYSPLESASTATAGVPSLDTYSATHPLMSGVSSAGALSHLDVFATGGDVQVIATWNTGEPFVAIKRLDPAPIAGRVIAINAPLEDGQWTGDVDEIVTNAIQWLSDNGRNPPWLEVSCSSSPLPPILDAASTAVDYTCPPVGSGDDWTMSLILDGSDFTTGGAVLHGKVTIEHNVSGQGRVNIPVTADLVKAWQVYLPLVMKSD